MDDVLVSVCVVTFNAADYIVETLNSVKNQTYKNLELVISDDHSFDETVNKCKQWINENQSIFKRVVLLEAPVNTGVSANYNRAFAAASGEWVKELDGDDILTPECISDYVFFVKNNPQSDFVFSIREEFGDDNAVQQAIESRKSRRYFYDLKTAKEQYLDLLIRGCPINSCTAFIKRSTFWEEGGYDETIPMCEDIPMWLKLTKNGYYMFFLPKVTVKYRIHDASIIHQQKGKRHRNIRFGKARYETYMKYVYQDLKVLDLNYALVKRFYYLRQSTNSNMLRIYCIVLCKIIRFVAKDDCRRLRNTKSIQATLTKYLIDIYKEINFISDCK